MRTSILVGALVALVALGCTRESDLRARERAEPAPAPAPPPAPGAPRELDGKLEQLLAGQERIERKLDEVTAKLEALEKKVGSGGSTAPARRGPDPAAVYAVPVDGGAVEGPAKAKVTLVMAFEFACPFCQRVTPTIAQLRQDYGTDLRVVKFQYIVHPERATVPARAYCAATRQNRHGDFEAKLWSDAFGKLTMDEPLMEKFAGELGLDVNRFMADLSGPCKQAVADQQATMARFGVSGTPAFFINGRFLSGARPIEQFKTLIDEELKKADSRIGNAKQQKKSGITADSYYDKVVLKEGKTSL